MIRGNGDYTYNITQDDDYLDPSTLYALPDAQRQAAVMAFMAEVQASARKDAERKAQQREATITRQRQVLYYQVDHLGTPQELTNQNGDIVWQATYAAWGNTLRIETPDLDNGAGGDGGGSNNNDKDQRKEITPFYDITRRKFAQNSKTAAANEARFGPADAMQQNLRFQGQYFDQETGLHYNNQRYYDPDIGRFINPDPIGFEGGSNSFQYAPNPVSWVDPQGLKRGGGPTLSPCCRLIRMRLNAIASAANKIVGSRPNNGLTPEQVLTVKQPGNGWMYNMFYGTQLDTQFKAMLRGARPMDPVLRDAGVRANTQPIASNVKSRAGLAPDVTTNRDDCPWFDLTTKGGWKAHVDKYSSLGTGGHVTYKAPARSF